MVALGAMGECLHLRGLLTSGTERADAYQQIAQYHYCKALKQLRIQMMNDAENMMNSALLSCLLFLCFESMVRASNRAALKIPAFQLSVWKHYL